jgi:hypothetical protein
LHTVTDCRKVPLSVARLSTHHPFDNIHIYATHVGGGEKGAQKKAVRSCAWRRLRSTKRCRTRASGRTRGSARAGPRHTPLRLKGRAQAGWQRKPPTRFLSPEQGTIVPCRRRIASPRDSRSAARRIESGGVRRQNARDLQQACSPSCPTIAPMRGGREGLEFWASRICAVDSWNRRR